MTPEQNPAVAAPETPTGQHSPLASIVTLACAAVALWFIGPVILGILGINLKFGDNLLEKALVIGKSTSGDFSAFRDEGGLDNADHASWAGYSVTNVRLSYDESNVLDGMVLTLVKNDLSGKIASFSNLKTTLEPTCPANWQDSGPNSQFSESATRICGIVEIPGSGKVEVTIGDK